MQWLMISVSSRLVLRYQFVWSLEFSGLFGDHVMSCAIAVANVACVGGRYLQSSLLQLDGDPILSSHT